MNKENEKILAEWVDRVNNMNDRDKAIYDKELNSFNSLMNMKIDYKALAKRHQKLLKMNCDCDNSEGQWCAICEAKMEEDVDKQYEQAAIFRRKKLNEIKKDPNLPNVTCLGCGEQSALYNYNHFPEYSPSSNSNWWMGEAESYIFVCNNKQCNYRHEYFINKKYWQENKEEVQKKLNERVRNQDKR